VPCTKISREFEFGVIGQRSRSPGTKKNKKVWHFVQESSSGARSCAALLAVVATPVGKSAHTVAV